MRGLSSHGNGSADSRNSDRFGRHDTQLPTNLKAVGVDPTAFVCEMATSEAKAGAHGQGVLPHSSAWLNTVGAVRRLIDQKCISPRDT